MAAKFKGRAKIIKEEKKLKEENMPAYGVTNSFVVLHILEWPSYNEKNVQIADSCRCCRCCCLGIALRAEMLKMSAWLLHPKW